jgi:hypothetical protein
MRNKLRHHGLRRSGPLCLATIAALFGAGIAGADATAPVVSHANGAMTFPNVRVVNAPELATSFTTPTGQSGRRIFVDPATGKPRPPTQEELGALRFEARKAAALKSHAAPQIELRFHRESGAIGAHLGESYMVNSVVQKQEDGRLIQFCVVGSETQAAKMMNLKTPSLRALQGKGGRDER